MSSPLLALFQMPGMAEMLLISAIGLLIWGKRLPEVGRNLGKGIVEFKKGLKGIEEDVEAASTPNPPTQIAPPPHKFDPYTGKPLDSNNAG
jgi:sec-independent protein translocase protein TatA